MKGACGGTRLDFKVEKDEKNLFQNVTRCFFSNPKSDLL